MKYIKEYCSKSKTAIIRSDTYAKSVQHVNNMALILLEDFNVDPEDIRIVLYAGRHYAKTLGVEVCIGDVFVSSEYREVPSLELYYG